MSETTLCGYIAIVGRPNVGKSTLLNHILGQKISITSRKPQTTRHQILGVKTEGNLQAVYVDTPGMHTGYSNALNQYMNRTADAALADVDMVLFMVDRTKWTPEDEAVLAKLKWLRCPVFLVVNKVDFIQDKETLLPYLQQIAERFSFAEIFPVSAKNGHNIEALESKIAEKLPAGPHFFEEDQITNRSSRFMAAEFVREKIMRQLGDELPYSMTVEIEEFKKEGKILHISALILVERAGQKKILIGDKGERIKSIGHDARKSMEEMFELKVMLNLWVKIKSGWSDDERALKSLGYNELG
jgi:GTP-binding protein Era